MKKIIAILLSILILGCSEREIESDNEELIKLSEVISRYEIKCEEQKKIIEQFKDANQGFVDNETDYIEAIKKWQNAYDNEAINKEKCKQAYNETREALILCNENCKERSQVVEKSYSSFLILFLCCTMLGVGFFGRDFWDKFRANRN